MLRIYLVGLEEMTKVKVINYDLISQLNNNLWWFPANALKFNLILYAARILRQIIFLKIFGCLEIAREFVKESLRTNERLPILWRRYARKQLILCILEAMVPI